MPHMAGMNDVEASVAMDDDLAATARIFAKRQQFRKEHDFSGCGHLLFIVTMSAKS